MSTKRTWVVGEAEDPETGEPLGEYDRQQLLACMEEVEHLLYMVGGMVAFAADRVQVGEHGGQPIAVSRQVIVTWTAFAPMRREAETPIDLPPIEVPPIAPELEDAAAELAADLLGEPDEDEDDEDVDRSLTTTGPPRADAELA